MKFFVKGCCKTMQARVVIFGMQVDTSLLMLILSCVCPIFVHILNNEFLYPRFEIVGGGGGKLVYICL